MHGEVEFRALFGAGAAGGDVGLEFGVKFLADQTVVAQRSCNRVLYPQRGAAE